MENKSVDLTHERRGSAVGGGGADPSEMESDSSEIKEGRGGCCCDS